MNTLGINAQFKKWVHQVSQKRIVEDQQGFTLVELMIVVAIIGILAAIAVPNYKRYQAKARQAEVKLLLAGVHTALSSFSVENNSFTACLKAIGVGGSTNGKQHYSFGIALGGTTCGPTGALACNHVSWSFDGTAYIEAGTACAPADMTFAANTSVRSGPASLPAADNSGLTNSRTDNHLPAGLTVSQSTFIAGATGNISDSGSAAIFDKWTIDQNKNLVNVTPGLE